MRVAGKLGLYWGVPLGIVWGGYALCVNAGAVENSLLTWIYVVASPLMGAICVAAWGEHGEQRRYDEEVRRLGRVGPESAAA